MTPNNALLLNPVHELILPRLQGVRSHGKGWLAKCPAHSDNKPSLSIGTGDKGQALLHCFAGCHAVDVLAAIGLELRDLYPREPLDASPMARLERREVWQAANVVAAASVLATEARVVEIAAQCVAEGEALFAEDIDRLHTAVARIEDAHSVLEGLA